MDNKASYTVAGEFPTKLLNRKFIYGKQIFPIHIQLDPTNKCNKNCNFCLCDDRDKQAEIPWEQMLSIIDTFKRYGVRSVTISGGGEPLLYRNIDKLMYLLNTIGIKVGLVTNGLTFRNLGKHNNLTWCRVSCEDNTKIDEFAMDRAISTNPRTDWAFSYVLSDNPNYDNIRAAVRYANQNNFTHVRIVSDLCNRNSKLSMETVKFNLRANETSKVIFQDRSKPKHGSENCWISLLKPIISPGGMFPCCGASYAINGEPRTMSDKMKMGELSELNDIFAKNIPFNGSICDNCYYTNYNSFIQRCMDDINHREFV